MPPLATRAAHAGANHVLDFGALDEALLERLAQEHAVQELQQLVAHAQICYFYNVVNEAHGCVKASRVGALPPRAHLVHAPLAALY